MDTFAQNVSRPRSELRLGLGALRPEAKKKFRFTDFHFKSVALKCCTDMQFAKGGCIFDLISINPR